MASHGTCAFVHPDALIRNGKEKEIKKEPKEEKRVRPLVFESMTSDNCAAHILKTKPGERNATPASEIVRNPNSQTRNHGVNRQAGAGRSGSSFCSNVFIFGRRHAKTLGSLEEKLNQKKKKPSAARCALLSSPPPRMAETKAEGSRFQPAEGL